MTAEQVLSAYIDTNIVLFIVAGVWFCAKHLIAQTVWKHAYLTQLHLLYALVAVVVLSPLIIYGMDIGQRWGLLPSRNALTFSDFLVAQYLHGNIAMTPSKFESLLMMRTELTRDIVSSRTWLGTLISVGLIGGFALIVIRNARDTIRLRRMIDEAYVLRRIGRIDVRVTHETTVPFSTRGMFRHYIVLPTGLLAQENDVFIAVSHEAQHVRQGDLTWEILLELLRPFFFWNPAFAYCKRDVERVRELACDQQVLSRPTHTIRDYCECLLRVCKTSLRGDYSNQIITPCVPFVRVDLRVNASHSENFLKRRIVSLLDNRSASVSRVVGAAAILALVVVVMTGALAMRPVNDWSHDRLMLSTIVNLERLNTRSATR